MKKMLMALLLCAALLPLWAGACAAENTPVPIEPAEAFAGGSGTAEDPFQIATAQQLALLAKVTHQEYEWNQWDEEELYLEGCYVLTADIALNDTSNSPTGKASRPHMSGTPSAQHRKIVNEPISDSAVCSTVRGTRSPACTAFPRACMRKSKSPAACSVRPSKQKSATSTSPIPC